MNIAIFTNLIGGHHLEYIHHVYEMAMRDMVNHYFFILPQKFNEIKNHFEWPESVNIDFCFFDEVFETTTISYFSQIICSYKICTLIKRYLRQYSCEILYVNTIMSILPMAPILLRSCNCKIFGIVYKIYLYDTKTSIFSFLANKIKYRLLSGSEVFSKVLVLNDNNGANIFNDTYSTKKFVAISDPFNKLPVYNTYDFRYKYDISRDMVVFAHLGVMSINKSTIEILSSLRYLDDVEKRKYVFVFAGIVEEEIKTVFYSYVNKLEKDVRLIIKNEYCSYEDIASICKGCDALLIPYRRTSQSSGIIGYASQFGKPVIAPSNGLLGRLVKQYGLGILIDEVTTDQLRDAYRRIYNKDYESPSLMYCEKHDVGQFQDVISTCINEIINNK